ncbi:MAG: hypothetical protein ACN2B6_00810 [Rickettsiales bacterium]
MYLEVTKSGRTDTVLKSWRGLSRLVTGVTGEYDRGIYKKTFLGLGFQVAGSSLYSFDSGFSKTLIGSINGGDQVAFADNGFVLIIVGGNTAYSYDGVSLSILSLSFTPSSVFYLNNQFFYTATDGRVYISTAGQTSVISGNSFSPDSSSDSLIRSYTFDQFVLNFSELTIEPWENTGSGIPPVERMDGVIQEATGLAGKNAIANTSQAVYFLGSDNEPYQMVNFQVRKIGDAAVSREIQRYRTSDCRLFHVAFASQDFIQWHFPSEGKVWLFSQQAELWYELDHDKDEKRYIGNSIARLFDRIVVGSNQDGHLFELDESSYQNDGVLMARERVARPLSGEQFDNPRQRIQFSELLFSVSTGVGTPEDVNPLMETEITTDGVKFGDGVFHELGREGEFQQTLRHSTNANCTDMSVKIRCTDNCDFSIYTAGALVREAGK